MDVCFHAADQRCLSVSAADVNCGADASPPSAHAVSPHAVSVVMETDAAGAERMTSPPTSSAGQVSVPSYLPRPRPSPGVPSNPVSRSGADRPCDACRGVADGGQPGAGRPPGQSGDHAGAALCDGPGEPPDSRCSLCPPRRHPALR